MPLTGPEMLLVEKKEGIEIITINRPERKNKFSRQLLGMMAEAWQDFKNDNDVMVAIITATGDTFVTGPDVVQMAKEEREPAPFRKPTGFIPRFFPYEIWKPIICAINGDASCGGVRLAEACDIRIAASNAMFSIAEVRWGLPAPWVGVLRTSLSLAHAYELALWGDGEYTAQRMYEMGWVNRVVPKDKVMEEAMAWARRMLDLNPRTVRNIKQLLWRSYTHAMPAIPEDWTFSLAASPEENSWVDENLTEGLKAFTENRKPKFKKLAPPRFWHGNEPFPSDLSWK